MPYSSDEWDARLDDTLRNRYSVWLMNDTKWREIWAIVCELRLYVQMGYADNPDWSGSQRHWGPFSLDMVKDDGIRDPGLAGPFQYRQIHWLRVPKVWPNDVERFKDRIAVLGQVPSEKQANTSRSADMTQALADCLGTG